MVKKLFILSLATLALATGCSKDEQQSSGQTGQIEFATAVSNSIDMISVKSDEVYTLDSSILPDTSLFSLTIESVTTDDGSTYYNKFENISDYNTPYLPTGTYKASISYGDTEEEGVDLPCFYGETEFTIVARKTIYVEISAMLSNSIIGLNTSEWFENYYPASSFTVTTEAGSTFNFSSDDDSYGNDKYFVKPDSKLYLNGSATKTNGYDVVFQKEEIGQTSEQTLHNIIIDASQAGAGGITITLDNNPATSVDAQEVELNDDAN